MRGRMAIVGGGPVGLGALLRARRAGWDATLYERGRPGENVRAWGHVRMFSPLWMNDVVNGAAPAGDAADSAQLLTGEAYVERHLEPLAFEASLAGRIRMGAEVLAISREGLRKGEAISRPERARRPFRLLIAGPDGEQVEAAEVVLDATGTFGRHNWLGEGGIPALGERALEDAVDYRLPNVAGRARAEFAGRHTLVVGAGHSAATAIQWLGDLARACEGTRVTWVTRSGAARPVEEVAEDPLPERARVVAYANDAAEKGAPWLTRIASAVVAALRRSGGVIEAEVAAAGGSRRVAAARVLALVGYRPDLDLARELQVQTCWATEGTYPLAAALLAETAVGAGCLQASVGGSAALRHPEPRFFTVGAKSYGRNPNFLIRAGLRQVDDVLAALE